MLRCYMKYRTESLSFLCVVYARKHKVTELLCSTVKNWHLSSVNFWCLNYLILILDSAGYIEGPLEKSIFAYTKRHVRRNWSGKLFYFHLMNFIAYTKPQSRLIDFSPFGCHNYHHNAVGCMHIELCHVNGAFK